jgi:hypothetical protein
MVIHKKAVCVDNRTVHYHCTMEMVARPLKGEIKSEQADDLKPEPSVVEETQQKDDNWKIQRRQGHT